MFSFFLPYRFCIPLTPLLVCPPNCREKMRRHISALICEISVADLRAQHINIRLPAGQKPHIWDIVHVCEELHRKPHCLFLRHAIMRLCSHLTRMMFSQRNAPIFLIGRQLCGSRFTAALMAVAGFLPHRSHFFVKDGIFWKCNSSREWPSVDILFHAVLCFTWAVISRSKGRSPSGGEITRQVLRICG